MIRINLSERIKKPRIIIEMTNGAIWNILANNAANIFVESAVITTKKGVEELIEIWAEYV